MKKNDELDEYLEKLWYMKEDGEDSIEVLKESFNDLYNSDVVDTLSADGLVVLEKDGTRIILTEEGTGRARQVIRSHRLAERLVYDVLGGEFEAGACEFEHIATPELVNSICTLLGHPRECPHGNPIPEGNCCKNSLETARSSVVPMTEMEIGQSARVAYINCQDDGRLHRLNGLQIKPGTMVKLHQTYPTFVVECEGANIALDESVSADIRVWRTPSPDASAVSGDRKAPVEKVSDRKRRGRPFGFDFGGKRIKFFRS